MVSASPSPATEPAVDSITALIGDLVRIPSRAGKDSYDPIVERLTDWLREAGLTPEPLRTDGGRLVGLTTEIAGGGLGPVYVLNATLDTAPYGDPSTWRHDPSSGTIEDGWLYGRGSSDSKAGVATFCHVGAALAAEADRLRGRVILLFDGDEHNGSFTGARTFFERSSPDSIDGLMIGYPGQDRIVVGARGFVRFTVTVRGEASHSGSSRPAVSNAVVKAGRLVSALDGWNQRLADQVEPDFELPPKATVTFIDGGNGFAIVPDRCTLGVDVRLTPAFDHVRAEQELRHLLTEFDDADPDRPSDVTIEEGWPPFRTPDDTAFVQALQRSAARSLNIEVPLAVVGPSSIANYAGARGIPATAGFGPVYRNLHAANECIELASLGPAYATYLDAMRQLLAG